MLVLTSLPFISHYTAEVYFGVALLSFACACHISPGVTTDLLGHTLQTGGVSQRMTEETANVYRLDKKTRAY